MTIFTWAGLVRRNPAYITKRARESWAVARAMKAFSLENRSCAWCGGTRGLQVHHMEPVSVAPERAADSANMVTLCAPHCHLAVGHLGNYANSFVRNVAAICSTATKIRIEDANA
jgi:hypothetical protein